MRAVVFGADGQLGSELMRAKWPTRWKPIVAPLSQFDFTHVESLKGVAALEPDAIINAAAYTAVDRAESESALAETINAHAPEAIARIAQRLAIPMFHISTDYVFDGNKTGEYLEDDAVNPLSVYGRTKERGEALVRAACEKHFILRTSWVFSSFGSNFVKTMLRLGNERAELRVVSDQVGRPTHAGWLARAILDLLAKADGPFGTFHYAGDTAMSWHELALQIFSTSRAKRPFVSAIATADYPTPARRPKNSRLATNKITDLHAVAPHDFAASLAQTVRELQGN